jgi:hypothetical protein
MASIDCPKCGTGFHPKELITLGQCPQCNLSSLNLIVIACVNLKELNLELHSIRSRYKRLKAKLEDLELVIDAYEATDNAQI